MSLYEFLSLLLEAVKIVIDIIMRLLRRRKKKKCNKKYPTLSEPQSGPKPIKLGDYHVGQDACCGCPF